MADKNKRIYLCIVNDEIKLINDYKVVRHIKGSKVYKIKSINDIKKRMSENGLDFNEHFDKNGKIKNKYITKKDTNTTINSVDKNVATKNDKNATTKNDKDITTNKTTNTKNVTTKNDKNATTKNDKDITSIIEEGDISLDMIDINDLYKLIENEETKESIIIYTDGSFFPNNGTIGCGIRIIYNNIYQNFSYTPLKPKNLNGKLLYLYAELTAIISCLTIIRNNYKNQYKNKVIDRIIIYTDSLTAVTSYKTESVTNKLLRRYYNYTNKIKTYFNSYNVSIDIIHVNGHRYDKDNTIADLLAKLANYQVEGVLKRFI